MFDSLALENWTPVQASVVVGLGLGLLFGALAQWVGFCLRRGLVGDTAERRAALAVWLTALAAAALGTTALGTAGLVDFSEHRFLASEAPVPAIVIGGLLFGAGMVLARGCASRLTVLSASGNLRALVAIATFAIVAHATLKGVLAPFRVWLGSATMSLPESALPGNAWGWSIAIAAAIAVFAARSGARPTHLLGGMAIGLLVPLGWVATGFVLLDEFDPITLESLAFTSASSEVLFWAVAGTAVAPAFGVGLFGGVLVGAGLTALARGEFRSAGFTSDLGAGRYLLGGALMGMGGVLAGGCTIGAGLTGTSLLSVAAFVALASIAAGALATQRILGQAPSALPVPAE